MEAWSRITTFLKKTWYLRIKKRKEKEILRDLSLIYEVQRQVYEYNCANKNRLSRLCLKTGNVFFKTDEVLHFELYFSLSEEKLFKKIDLDIEHIIWKFEKERYENFLIIKEYVCAKYPQEYKKIDVGDRVLRYALYSQIYKRSFCDKKNNFVKKEKFEEIINFFDYYNM